jgi:tetratricopeptide (TPR) repeat protein
MATYIGNFDNAIKYLTEAYKTNGNDPLVTYNLAFAYSKKGDLKKALSLINNCLKTNPNYAEAKNLKQKILNQLKK